MSRGRVGFSPATARRPTLDRTAGTAGRVAALLLLLATPSRSAAAEVLFPERLHLTRTVSDSLSGSTSIVEEYLQGNRMISIRGSRVSIADYEKGELTEIDHAANTYSITRFESIANARGNNAPALASRGASGWKRIRNERVMQDGRDAELVELESPGARLRVVFDQRLKLSREAVSVLAGAAFPSLPSAESSAVIEAAAVKPAVSTQSLDASTKGAGYRLMLGQSTEFEIGGERVRLEQKITRVESESAPLETIAIPRGARLVESPLVRVQKELEAMDRIPGLKERP